MFLLKPFFEYQKYRKYVMIAVLSLWTGATAALAQTPEHSVSVAKIRDVVIYNDDTYYSAFPSIVCRPDGELIVAFRRAPERRNFGNALETHTDACSQLVLVRSSDHGETWSKEPQLLFAYSRGGLQDPCMLQLDNGSILCASYGWALLPQATSQKLENPSRAGEFVATGGLLLRSEDGCKTWAEINLPSTPGEKKLGPFNKPLPICNRGAMVQGKDGRIFWVTAAENPQTKITATYLWISEDGGNTWNYSCPVAMDDKVAFNETSIYETPKGNLVAFLRTEGFNDHTVIARSIDGGKSFQPWQDTGFMGHPHHAIRLPNDQVLLVYGYRHNPCGIRARVLDPECTNWATAPEIILREDGGSWDLGYPWATLISPEKVLVVYYFNQQDGARHIAGTLLDIVKSK